MREWKKIILGTCIKVNSKSIDKNYPFNTVLYLDTGSITNNRIHNLQKMKLSEAPVRAKRLVSDGDIIFSTVRPDHYHHGLIKNPEENLVVSTAFAVISCDKKRIDPFYLYYYLTQSSTLEHLQTIAEASTSAYPSIKTRDIEMLKINLPQLSQQKAIVEVIKNLYDKIELCHRQNHIMYEISEILYKQCFINEARSNWKETALENLCLKISSGGTPSTKKNEYYNGSIDWYSTKELNDGYLHDSLVKISDEGLKNSTTKLFPKHSVLMAIYAAPSVGRLGILTREGTFNQATCGLVANDGICYYEFIYLFLKSQRREFNAKATGSVQQNLNVDKIKKYPAFLPDKERMGYFKKVVHPIFSKIEKNTLQIFTLKKLCNFLLPKLLSGEIRIS